MSYVANKMPSIWLGLNHYTYMDTWLTMIWTCGNNFFRRANPRQWQLQLVSSIPIGNPNWSMIASLCLCWGDEIWLRTHKLDQIIPNKKTNFILNPDKILRKQTKLTRILNKDSIFNQTQQKLSFIQNLDKILSKQTNFIRIINKNSIFNQTQTTSEHNQQPNKDLTSNHQTTKQTKLSFPKNKSKKALVLGNSLGSHLYA